MHVAAGGRRFIWDFLLADVALPIISADFLRHFGLLVDLGEIRILHVGAIGASTWCNHLAVACSPPLGWSQTNHQRHVLVRNTST